MTEKLAFVDTVEGAIETLREVFEQNPAVYAVVATAFKRLQDLVKDIGIPDSPDRAITADDLAELTRGAIKDLKAAQSSKEKVLQLSVDSVDAVLTLIASLLALDI